MGNSLVRTSRDSARQSSTRLRVAATNGMELTVSLATSPIPTIAINNQGVIPPQIRDRFFERYATFGKEHGTGLGVFSARLMARTLGGELSFTTDETDGTTLVMVMNSGASTQG